MKHLPDTIRAVDWQHDCLHLLDQRQLPLRQEILKLQTVQEVTKAIQDMVVRGAPAIGITAAYGVVLAARSAYVQRPTDWMAHIETDLHTLSKARPTAVNLTYAINRMRALFPQITGNPVPELLAEARLIHEEDIQANYRMGELGANLLPNPCRVLTHCNAGALATGGYGTALGVIRTAFAHGKLQQVYADETRPWLQGARLTAWELKEEGIPCVLIADSAAAMLMRNGLIDWIIVGADRITANGDVANKIGTYSLAVLARYHHVKMMVVAPTTTFDSTLASGNSIIIEERSPHEVTQLHGHPIAPMGIKAWNPAFDITPAELIDVIVTEKGYVEHPNSTNLASLLQ